MHTHKHTHTQGQEFNGDKSNNSVTGDLTSHSQFTRTVLTPIMEYHAIHLCIMLTGMNLLSIHPLPILVVDYY